MDWPYTSEEWFWTIMFAVVLIGAAGGWAFLIKLTVSSIRYRRELRSEPHHIDDATLVSIGYVESTDQLPDVIQRIL